MTDEHAPESDASMTLGLDPWPGRTVAGTVVGALTRTEGRVAWYSGRNAAHGPVAFAVLSGVVSPTHRRLLELLGQLESPHAVRLLDAGEIERVPYAAFEQVRGPSLADLIAEGPMEPARAIHIARRLAECLAEAHDLGLHHGALRPESVSITRSGAEWTFPKLGDFPLAEPRIARADADITALGEMLRAMLRPDQADLPPALPWLIGACTEANANRVTRIGDLELALDAALVALEDPRWWDVSFSLVDGRIVIPGDLEERISGGTATRRLPRRDVRSGEFPSAPDIPAEILRASAPPTFPPSTPIPLAPPPAESRGVMVPALVGAVVVLLLLLVGLLGVGIGAIVGGGSAAQATVPPQAPVEVVTPAPAADPPPAASAPTAVEAAPLEAAAATPSAETAPPAAPPVQAKPRGAPPRKAATPSTSASPALKSTR